MKYKLLVLDIGRTLLDDEKEIIPRTLAALLKVQRMGVHLALAPGRPTYGILPLTRRLELGNYDGYIMSHNGAQVINTKNGEVLLRRCINPGMLPYLERKAYKNGFSISTYTRDRMTADYANNEYILWEACLNGMELIEGPEFSATIGFAPSKCILVSDDEEVLVTLKEHWKKHLSGVLDVFRSGPYFLEVLPCGIDKSTSLRALLSHLDITPEETIMIGDGVRDASMIQSARLGVAMGDAQGSVKVYVDVVTALNEEDGVTLAVERAILAEIRPAEIPLDQLSERTRHILMRNLGAQYTCASEDRVGAAMPVDGRARQSFGILYGGATLTLAETIAGLGSMILCQPDGIVVGMQVSGDHISPAHEGDTVRAIDIIIHKDRSSHVWDVDVSTSADELVSSTRVVDSVLKRR